MAEIECRLEALGCPELGLMVRHDNRAAIGLYERLGYDEGGRGDPGQALDRRRAGDMT